MLGESHNLVLCDCIFHMRTVRLGRMCYFDDLDCKNNLTWGFICAQVCDPNMDDFFCWPMSPHKEVTTLCGTLVALFDQKHFLAEKKCAQDGLLLYPKPKQTVDLILIRVAT